MGLAAATLATASAANAEEKLANADAPRIGEVSLHWHLVSYDCHDNPHSPPLLLNPAPK